MTTTFDLVFGFFEVAPQNEMHPLFLKIAAEAVEEFEAQTGIAYFRDSQDAANSR